MNMDRMMIIKNNVSNSEEYLEKGLNRIADRLILELYDDGHISWLIGHVQELKEEKKGLKQDVKDLTDQLTSISDVCYEDES